MDSLTQAVLGATVGYAFGGRYLGRKAALWGIGLGTLPDLDVLIQSADPIDSYILHRSWSHSFLVTGLVSLPIGLAISRLHKNASAVPGRMVLMVSLIFFTHILLDAMTIYGTQIFWILSDFLPALPQDPIGLGSVAIIDPIYTAPLLFAAIWVLLRGSIRSSGPNILSEQVTIAALTISTLYLGWGLFAQYKIVKHAEDQMASNGIIIDRLLASPTFGNSLLWYVLVQEGDKVHYGVRSLLDDENQLLDFAVMERRSDLLIELPNKAAAQKVMNFSKGFYRFAETADGLSIADMRMGLPPNFDLHFEFALANRNSEDGTLTALSPTKHLFPQVNKENFIYVWDRIFNERATLDI
ncbi:metal-dependent hydrolase [Roseibium aggregatum]|uniref:metal-dependent hydrolase n=1 Tax=Roseibium aggregatum TaxID=187304 RepID=UPI0025AC63E7|nr:metal-dependent hydrolase [Roseibium aggregatum]WJS05676.1 metal-dependent hydrolase [Roseibium aggregatum]